jgi:aminoglycoside 3-N-acetyltransferase I
MTNFTVQCLGPEDLALMRQVNRLFGDAFEDAERYQAAPPSDEHLRQLLADPGFVALAVSEADGIVGALTAYELVKYERETREIYLYDIAVIETRRRLGAATILIQALRSIAAVRSAEIVFVQADRDDPAAVALYERFAERRDVYHFDISPG